MLEMIFFYNCIDLIRFWRIKTGGGSLDVLLGYDQECFGHGCSDGRLVEWMS